MIGRFLRFAGVGAATTAIQYVVLVICVALGMLAGVGSFLGYAVSSLVSYYANYHLTFTSTREHREALPRFLATVIAGITLNTFIVSLLADRFGVHYLVAQIIATTVTFATNFLSNDRWTFRQKVGP